MAQIESAILSGLGEGKPAGKTQAKGPEVSAASKAVEIPVEDKKPVKANILQGVGAAPGIAIGPVFQFQRQEISINEVSDGLVMGWERLQDALTQAREQLENLNHQMTEKGLQAEAAIFEAHLELLTDPELTEAVQGRIQKGQDALRAWKETIEDNAMMVAALNDPILSARADDLRDVGRRVLKIMLGMDDKKASMPETPTVVVARKLSPSDTVTFDQDLVLACRHEVADR